MVKRLGAYLFGGVVLLLLLLAAAGAWLVGTTAGLEWLLVRAERASGGSVRVAQAEGRLWDDFCLAGITAVTPGGTVAIDRLQVDWSLWRLAGRQLEVAALRLDGLRLTLHPSSGAAAEPPLPPPDGSLWPAVPVWMEHWQARLHAIEITDARISGLREEPLDFACGLESLRWTGRELAWEGLQLRLPQGALRLAGELAPERQQLALTGELTAAEPLAGFSRLAFSFTPGQESDRRRLAGRLALSAWRADGPPDRLETSLVLTRAGLDLAALSLELREPAATVAGDASLRWGPALAADARLTLNLREHAPVTGITGPLVAELSLAGTWQEYAGEFSLRAGKPTPWRLSGRYRGTPDRLNLSAVRGALLGGGLTGQAALSWAKGLALTAELRGANLDPGRWQPEWPGRLDFTAGVTLGAPEGAPLAGRARIELLPSLLRHEPLSGRAELAWDGSRLEIAELELAGNELRLAAAGILQERIALRFELGRPGLLLPTAAGSLRGEGWFAWPEAGPGGMLSAVGSDFSYGPLHAGQLELAASLPHPGADGSLTLEVREVAYGEQRFDTARLTLNGRLAGQDGSLEVQGENVLLRLETVGGYADGAWSGEVRRLDFRTERPGSWSLDPGTRLLLSPRAFRMTGFHLRSTRNEEVIAELEWALDGRTGRLELLAEDLDLDLLAFWLPGWELGGLVSGELSLRREDQAPLLASVYLEGQAQLRQEPVALNIAAFELEGRSDAAGWTLAGLVRLADGQGQLRAEAGSPFPLVPGRPPQGGYRLRADGIDLALAAPWIPADVALEGRFNADCRGLVEGGRFTSAGRLEAVEGEARWQLRDGEMRSGMKSVLLAWDWREETLAAQLDVTLETLGELTASAELPLAPRFPLTLPPDRPLAGAARATLSEQGLIGIFLPGLVAESRGAIAAEAHLAGTWPEPQLSGRLELTDAGGFLPGLGIELSDLDLTLALAPGGELTARGRVLSGGGWLELAGQLVLDDWRLRDYRGELTGERFLLIHQPELYVRATPRLTFAGTRQRLTLRGEVLIPEFLAQTPDRRAMIEESGDVLLGDAGNGEEDRPLVIDAQVTLRLGEKVRVRFGGLDARLAGAVDLSMGESEELLGRGRIRVAEGRFVTYGTSLDIERGELLFTGGAVATPALDILAMREVGEVKAGVLIGGTPREPVVELWSDPAMSDIDVLGYLVLGYPPSGDSSQGLILSTAAAYLLSTTDAASLQESLAGRFSFDLVTAEEEEGGTVASMVNVGMYLTPKLYVSYGHSLNNRPSTGQLRYTLSRRWEVESRVGEQSSADLYYTIRFR